MNKDPLIDIDIEDLETVKRILANHLPHQTVWAFGSRITGKARKFSDLDLAIITNKPVDFETFAALKESFSESNLPFKVDVVDWSTTDDKFKQIIKNKFVVVQQ